VRKILMLVMTAAMLCFLSVAHADPNLMEYSPGRSFVMGTIHYEANAELGVQKHLINVLERIDYDDQKREEHIAASETRELKDMFRQVAYSLMVVQYDTIQRNMHVEKTEFYAADGRRLAGDELKHDVQNYLIVPGTPADKALQTLVEYCKEHDKELTKARQ